MAGSPPPAGSSSTSSKPAQHPPGGSAGGSGGGHSAPAGPTSVTSPEGSLTPPVVLGPDSPIDPVPDLVIKCQKRLIELGWLPKSFDANGEYGPADGPMSKAVKAFQGAAKIVQNGLLGPMGQAALFAANAPRNRPSKTKYPDHGAPRSVAFPQVAGVFTSHQHVASQYSKAVQEWGPMGTFLTYCQPGKLDNALDLFGRSGLVPQIGWEPTGWNLAAMVAQFEKHWDEYKDGQPTSFDSSNSDEAMIAATLDWADKCKQNSAQTFFLRPMSEMTMPGGATNTWHLMAYSPKVYANAWNWIHRVFDARGATNVLFCFNVAQDSVSHALNLPEKAAEALKLIEPGRIDSCGIHPYTRKDGVPNFKLHCTAWIDIFKAHRPSVHVYNIGEFGFEQGADGVRDWVDAPRAAALGKSLEWAQGHFRMITYFDDHFDWRIEKDRYPRTWAVVHDFLRAFPNYHYSG